MNLIQLESKTLKIEGFAESRIGGRKENQDSWSYAETAKGFLVTVCDGMGGGPGGKTASTIAVETIVEVVKESDEQDAPINALLKAIRKANSSIIEKAEKEPELKGMGSTCTAVLFTADSAIIAHVGDSRVYQLRGASKVFRTFDHSMVFDLVKQRVITEEQARLSAQSNIITRALGVKADVEIDVTERPYESGDRFLLCTDGIHGALEEKELIRMIAKRNAASLGVVVEEVATEIDNIGNQSGGGHDNLTIVLVETKENSIKKEVMSKTVKLLLIGLSVLLLLSLVGNVVQGCTSDNQDSAMKETLESMRKDKSNKIFFNKYDSIYKSHVNSKTNQKEEEKK